MTRRVLLLVLLFPAGTTLGFFVSVARRTTPPLLRAEKSSLQEQSSQSSQSSLPYDWRAQWYPVAFAAELPRGKEPSAFTIFDEPIVLWRDPSAAGSEFRCAEDRCPHRLAALSQGAVEPDGSLRCYYHGWAFNGEGTCVAVPQLATSATIPKAARVRTYPTAVVEGIIWVWAVADGVPSRDPPRSADNLDASPGFAHYDFQIDLPYEQSWLVENLFDPAHVPISHDRTQGGGRREAAEAYVMEVDDESINEDGFTGRYRGESKVAWTQAKFEAPGVIRYRSERLDEKGEPKTLFGAALHCVPRGRQKSRLLFRTYFKKSGLPLPLLLYLFVQPKWKRHLNSCKVLEQDLGLITSQEDRPFESLAKDTLTIKSSDTFVVAYRSWLDRIKQGLPYKPVGWKTNDGRHAQESQDHQQPQAPVPAVVDPDHRSRQPRLLRHVYISHISRTALKNTVRCRNAALLAFVLSTTSAAAATTAAVAQPLAAVGLLSAAVAAASAKVERAFYKSFDRHAWRP